ncbi:MAG: hypothetical protein K2J78_13455 [Muribaculaceae bacterium]|nr:hypothetical protein [Muribaculaceae bacterium]
MRKSLLTGLLALAAISANAQDETTYNFFDPADCDAEGWLWLDTAEKIAKYVGEDKKIKLVGAQYEIEDPMFPGAMIYPETVADPTVEGYNTKGVKGGEGSKTGGIICPAALEDWLGNLNGGGILVQMPDCASFDLYLSQECPNVMLDLEGAWSKTDASGCKYIHANQPAYWDWEEDDYVTTEYAGYDYNLQDYTYDWTNLENQDPALEKFSIFGEKGNPRTAYVANYSTECPTIIQGIRIRTFTDESDAAVEGIIADADVNINGKTVVLSAPAEISVYNAAGVKVAGAYGTSLDCSALNGLYIVKARNKAVKVNF